MSSRCGRTNRNERGSSYNRRARRKWLVSPAAGFGGDGVKVPCWECGRMLTEDEVIADRRVPGSEGGTYRRDNIRGPHCPRCSCRQGAKMTAAALAAYDPYNEDDTCKRCGAHYLAQHAPACPVPDETRW